MEPELIIHAAGLREGQVEKIDEEVEGSFLSSEGAQFPGLIQINGEAYLAGDCLIIRLHLKTRALVPCRICNEPTEVLLDLPDFYTAEEGVQTQLFDCIPLIRESLLVELPPYLECHGGHCPHRAEMVEYLDHPSKEGYHPFKDL
ncbi:MAG: hypothetical protein AB7F31_03825 [Parachlamydiales bacterium]